MLSPVRYGNIKTRQQTIQHSRQYVYYHRKEVRDNIPDMFIITERKFKKRVSMTRQKMKTIATNRVRIEIRKMSRASHPE
jgi:hypothetical protein